MKFDLEDVKDSVEETEPSKYSRILFVLSDYDNDFSPLIVGHDGFYIGEEIANIGHYETADLIPMPAWFQQDDPMIPVPSGFFVWEGEVDFECVAGPGWDGDPAEYQLTLDKGTVRKATVDDLALAIGDFHIPGMKP